MVGEKDGREFRNGIVIVCDTVIAACLICYIVCAYAVEDAGRTIGVLVEYQ